MIKTLIWDLDGTLINSYDVITRSLYEITTFYHIPTTKDDIYQYILTSSVNDYLKNLEKQTNIPFNHIKQQYTDIVDTYSDEIELMNHAIDVLKETTTLGIQHFMYTHKGNSTFALLKRLGIDSYFTEILTNTYGFERKPHPEAINYFISKYHLNNDETYYVGDRLLDIECAHNANIHSILYQFKENLVLPTGKEDLIIHDLQEIVDFMNNPIGLKRHTVKMVAHQKVWEYIASNTINELNNILKETAISIQHVGSTAIQNISAKPIIDLVVGVKQLEDIQTKIEILERNGFIYRGSDVQNQLLFVQGDLKKDTRTHHIHVVKYDSQEWHNYIDFRDYLNENEKKAKMYHDLKIELAMKYPGDRHLYTKYKADFVEQLLKEANESKKSK